MFDCFPNAEKLRTAKDKIPTFKALKPQMIAQFDSLKAQELMQLMVLYDAHWVPTLQTLNMSAFANDSSFRNQLLLQYIPSLRKTLWWNPDLNRAASSNETPENKELNQRFLEAARKQIKAAHTQGVPIMTGTDVTDTYVFPGFSIHKELEDLTICGLSNLEALQAATLVPACFSEMDHCLGSIEEGFLADLVILNQNPLEKHIPYPKHYLV